LRSRAVTFTGLSQDVLQPEAHADAPPPDTRGMSYFLYIALVAGSIVALALSGAHGMVAS
jgi:nitrate reductase NapE component